MQNGKTKPERQPVSKKEISRIIKFLLNDEGETEEDARKYLKRTGAKPDEMTRKVMEILEGRNNSPDKSGFREERSTDCGGGSSGERKKEHSPTNDTN